MISQCAELLSHALFPLVHLVDLQALRSTTHALRAAVDTAPPAVWLKAARVSLPAEHPLCSSASASIIPHQANQLARLHSRVRSGRPAASSVLCTRHVNCEKLEAHFNPQGSLVIMELEDKLELHKLVLDPAPHLCQVSSLPSPASERAGYTGTLFLSEWAPDGTAAILLLLLEATDQCLEEESSRLPFIQALYVVEAQGSQLVQLGPFEANVVIAKATFTLDSSHILSVWGGYRQGDQEVDQIFLVFSRSGRLVATFQIDDLWLEQSWACIGGNRVAIPHPLQFSVWDLSSGEVQCYAGPQGPTPDAIARGGLITANAPGDKLAFCMADDLTVHICDAGSFAKLGCVRPASQDDLCLQPRQLDELFWGPYGWMLVLHPAAASAYAHLQMLVPDADRKTHTQMLWRDCQSQRRPASSPDGALVCIIEPETAELVVLDIRSGQRQLQQSIMAVDAEGFDVVATKGMHDQAIDLWWSSCGRHILLRILAREGDSDTASIKEQLLIVQL